MSDFTDYKVGKLYKACPNGPRFPLTSESGYGRTLGKVNNGDPVVFLESISTGRRLTNVKVIHKDVVGWFYGILEEIPEEDVEKDEKEKEPEEGNSLTKT